MKIVKWVILVLNDLLMPGMNIHGVIESLVKISKIE